ncbi:Tannase/feruloyl esterase [Xylogone sp. PMI_703]|nr:Tannase/feruloyl esterase [Xylogone sp. PMI_703]
MPPPGTPCTQLKPPTVPGAEVLSISATEKWNYNVSAVQGLLPNPIYGLDICEVNVVLTHPGAQDKVLVTVWLPLQKWNGRFQATGGTGYAAGTFDPALGPAVQLGYSSASTDAGAGSSLNPLSPAGWALLPDGTVNWEGLTNFAHRSVFDLGTVGKEITAQFYGKKPEFSYWNGCSTGGRQAMAAAQRYPNLFDGILAGAPAINWATYVVAEQWPQVVMTEERTFPSQCELKYFTDSAIAQCDELDGIKDGVITNPDICNFDPYRLVGKRIPCDGDHVTITESVASVVVRIFEGPFSSAGLPYWYGLNVGTQLDSLANTTVVNGGRVGFPLFVNDAWIRYWLVQNPDYNISTIDYATFGHLFAQSKAEYDDIIGTDSPDLSGFQNTGGKLIVWQGLADQLIFPKGTIDYRKRVERLMGGPAKVDEFFRLFLAPGVDHCAGGTSVGAVPSDIFQALVTWVEKKKAPDTVKAVTTEPSTGAKLGRILCPYPQVAYYSGGDKNSERSFACV